MTAIHHHIAYGLCQFPIGLCHILGIFFRLQHRNLFILCIPYSHGLMSIGMAADLIAISRYGSQQVRVIRHIPGNDEECRIDLMLVQDIKQLVE